MPRPTAAEIVQRAEALRTAYLGLMLVIVPLLDPSLPLVDVLRKYGPGLNDPIEVRRKDGSIQSSESIGAVLTRMASLRGDILREDLLTFAAMHGAVRLGDMLVEGNLMKATVPILQFGRHLRNACAHGNRWHFGKGEPRYRAALRGQFLDASIQGTQAIFGLVGPGEYLDYLEDLAAYLCANP